MTKAEYLALQDRRGDKYTEIVRLLDAAGGDGFTLLRDLQLLRDETDAAYRELSHEERMEILMEERRRRQELLDRIDARRAHGPVDVSVAGSRAS